MLLTVPSRHGRKATPEVSGEPTARLDESIAAASWLPLRLVLGLWECSRALRNRISVPSAEREISWFSLQCVCRRLMGIRGPPRWLSGKESICQCRRHRFDPWVGKIPCKRKWQATPVFLPWESLGQRSLAGYSLWGHKESITTQQLNNNNKGYQRLFFTCFPRLDIRAGHLFACFFLMSPGRV